MLKDLISVIWKGTTIWVSDDPTTSQGLYFGPADECEGDIVNRIVKEVYPEHYPAIGRFVGITIILDKKDETNSTLTNLSKEI